MKRIKVIACKVLMRELYYLAYQSRNVIDFTFLRQGLHDEPKKLTRSLQAAIDAIENEEETYDAICLGYGLCSNGILGIRTKKTPIVVPRAHDCISLLLGSKEKYSELFSAFPGIYWYSAGWLEHNRKGMPGPDRINTLKQRYLDQFGDEDIADALLETELDWMHRYGHAIFVDWEAFDTQEHKEYTKNCAEFLNWKYLCEPGSPSLLRDMLEGNWNEEKFQFIPPGETLRASFDDKIIALT